MRRIDPLWWLLRPNKTSRPGSTPDRLTTEPSGGSIDMDTIQLTVPAEAIHPGDIITGLFDNTGRRRTVARVRPALGGIELLFADEPPDGTWDGVYGPVEIERPKSLLAEHFTRLAAAAAAGPNLACALSDLILGVTRASCDELAAELAAGTAALDAWRHAGRAVV